MPPFITRLSAALRLACRFFLVLCFSSVVIPAFSARADSPPRHEVLLSTSVPSGQFTELAPRGGASDPLVFHYRVETIDLGQRADFLLSIRFKTSSGWTPPTALAFYPPPAIGSLRKHALVVPFETQIDLRRGMRAAVALELIGVGEGERPPEGVMLRILDPEFLPVTTGNR